MSQPPARPRRGRKKLSKQLAAWMAAGIGGLAVLGSAVAGADKFASSVAHLLDVVDARSIVDGSKPDSLEKLITEGAIDWRPIQKPQDHHVLVAAFVSSGDGLQHVIVATGRGDLDEYWFGEGGRDAGQRAFKVQSDQPGATIVDLAAYYSDFDGMNHVVLLDSRGTVRDASYSPGRGQPAFRVLATVPHALHIAAAPFEDAREQKVAVVVAAERQTIKLLSFDDRGDHIQQKDADLDVVDRVEDLAAFWVPSTGRLHVLAVTGDSRDTTVRDYWSAGAAFDRRTIEVGQPAQRIAGFDTGGAYLTIAVAGKGNVLATTRVGEASAVPDESEAELSGLQIGGIAGYYYEGDSYRHIMIASTNGGVYEIWFRS